MSLPTPKELKKLAAACRKSGITSLKGDGFEITLGDIPVKEPIKKAKKLPIGDLEQDKPEVEDTFENMTLEQRLFWSSTSDINNGTESGNV